MPLRVHLFIRLVFTLAMVAAAVHVAFILTLEKRLLSTEAREASYDVERSLDALQDGLQRVELINHDWAEWDDTYNFVQRPFERYRRENLTVESLRRIGANLVAYVSPQGHVVAGVSCQGSPLRLGPLPKDIYGCLRVGGAIMPRVGRMVPSSGILRLSGGPVAVFVRPILNSSGLGRPRGLLLFGRWLTSAEFSQAARVSHLPVTARPWGRGLLPGEPEGAGRALLAGKRTWVHVEGPEWVSGYGALRDLAGQPAVLVRVREPREAYKQGQRSYHFFMAWLLLFALVTGIVSLALVERLIVSHSRVRETGVRFRALVRNTSDIIGLITPEARLDYLSPAIERMLGHPPRSLVGDSLLPLVHVSDLSRVQSLLDSAVQDGAGTVSATVRLCHADGSWRYCEVSLCNQLAEPGVAGLVLTCRDVTERRAFESQLTHQAFHDSLTGLPNRALFRERLERALVRADRAKSLLAVLFLDLDGFKLVNDSLGHSAGDALLITIAQRLQSCVRQSDTVARLGGDEFTVLLEDLATEEQAHELGDRILQTVAVPIPLEQREVRATGSIGIALNRPGDPSPEEILRNADTAMYKAKSWGRARYVAFTEAMVEEVLQRVELESNLRRALELEEFELYYQPIVDLSCPRIAEMEALVRWRAPGEGVLPPGRFIPLAEQTGFIVPLGEWVLRRACFDAQRWSDQSLAVSVNLSAKQLEEPDLVQVVGRILCEEGLKPERLKLEITESVMMHDISEVVPKLEQLRALGVRLAVDDFGTGYSSMSYLAQLPIDTLKIDRSFISRLGQSAGDDAIVRTMVGLAKGLNLRITSEGIETLFQREALQELGVHCGQGYLFSRPVPGHQVEGLISGEIGATA